MRHDQGIFTWLNESLHVDLVRGALAVFLSVSMASPLWASEALLPGANPSAPQRFKMWGFEIYDALLWSRPGFSVQQYTAYGFGLELVYLRKFDGKDIAMRSMEEMKKIGSFSPDQEKVWLKAMADIFPNVQKGDSLLGIYKPNEGAEFWSNQKRLGVVPDPLFAKLFFGIWLHEATSAPALRQAWLNKP